MAAFSLLPQDRLQQFIDDFNQGTNSADSKVALGLINGHSVFVVSGIAESVAMFVKYVRQQCAPEGSDQSQLLYSQRKPKVQITYLNTTVPCHCSLLRSAAEEAYKHALLKGWLFDSVKLRLPVSSSTDGHDLRSDANLTKSLIESICILQVNWPAVISKADATHIVDFSPGTASPFAMMTHSLVQGAGVTVIPGGSLVADPHGQ
ncbi:beta subunit of fatty acid synthetase, partial [Linderina pennispora]